MDFNQIYNQSAMLHDAFLTKCNESNDSNEKEQFSQLAEEQRSISERLKQIKTNHSEN